MKFFKYIFVVFIISFFTSCINTDYLNTTSNSNTINLSSNEIFNTITKGLSLPNFKSLNENELLDLYAIDPKILLDYVANIPNDNISGTEISIFRLKDKSNTTEVVLGIERRIEELRNDFMINKQSEYDLIKNPYIKVFDNYVVFALHKNTDTIDKVLNEIF